MSKDRYRPSTADFEVVRTKGRTVDPRLHLPFAVEYDPESLGEWSGEEDEPNDSVDSGEDTTWVPTGLRVVNQVVRYNEQGFMRVDVTLAWEKLSGVEEYSIRVVQADEGA